MNEQQASIKRRNESNDGSCLGKALAVFGSLLSAIYLMNFTMGVVEIPDSLPFVGNIDEVAASAILFSCLSYLGIDVIPRRRGRK